MFSRAYPLLKRSFCQVPKSLSAIKEQIILGSFLHLNTSGFSEDSISRACNDIGLSSSSNRLLETGPVELVYHLLDEWDSELALDAEENFEEKMTPEEKISLGIKLRLRKMQPYIKHWDQAMALLGHPANVVDNYKRLFSFANELCYQARERSTDVKN